MQVSKWGNSLAVRLPASVVEALGLKEGDEVEIHVSDAREIAIARRPTLKALLLRDEGRAEFDLPKRGGRRRRKVDEIV